MFAKSFFIGFSLLLTFIIAGCDNKESAVANTSANTITIEHTQGTTVVPINPNNVVVFNTATLDTIDALGIQVVGIPKTGVPLPSFLEKYKGNEYMNAGTLFEPDYEALSNLKPDLIIAGGRTVDAYNKLSEIAPTIALVVDNKDFVNSLVHRTEQLGQIFGKEAEAQKLLAEFNQKIDTVKAKSANQGSAMVIMINGGKMAAYGPGSRFGFIFDELGFKPAIVPTESGSHGNVINAELLLSANPDWLFVLDRDSAIGNKEAQSAQQVLDNPLIQRTNAWTNDKIVYLDSSAMYIAGGLQTYSQLLDQINQELTDHQE